MDNIAVIGAGISGASVSRIISDLGGKPAVFEKSIKPGGLVKCEIVQGTLYHLTGGHVFNSKDSSVVNWFWSIFEKSDFVFAKRNAKILFGERKVPYPIENNLSFLERETTEKIVSELLSLKKESPSNFNEFLVSTFGDTLNEIYFKPYNEKIWKTDLSKVPLEWLEGKLPMPSVKDILTNNIYSIEESQMVHSSFYYPKNGGSQFIIDTLLRGVDLYANYEINSIVFTDGKLVLNNSHRFDKLIYTGNIKNMGSLFKTNDSVLLELFARATRLKSNGTSNVLCHIKECDSSWEYLPEPRFSAHRIIYTGNFSESNDAVGGRSAVIEFSGEIQKEEAFRLTRDMPFEVEPIAYNYTPYSYVIQDAESRDLINKLKKALEKYNIYLLGRFAEWEYKNMDICMADAMKITKKL